MIKKVQCLISGISYPVSKTYYSKKIEEYGDEDTLVRYFASKKVKSLIQRGYSVNEIRNILNVDSSELPGSDSQSIIDIVTYHSSRNKKNTPKNNFIKNREITDANVQEFINNIKDLNL